MAGITPEGRVKKKVKEILAEYGAYAFMPVQNGMGAPALDFHGIYRGIGFCIETKAPGKKPTKRQLHTMETVAAAGGKCFVIDGEVGYKQLREWLTLVFTSTGANDYVAI